MGDIESKFREFEEKIEKLKTLEKELDSLDTVGFESDVAAIRSMLKSPSKIPEIKNDIRALKAKIEESKIPVKEPDLPDTGELKVETEKSIPDISIKRTVTETSIREGDKINVTIELKNQGKTRAKAVSFSDRLDDSVKIVSGVNSWTGELKEGEAKLLEYRIKPEKAGKYTIHNSTMNYKDNQGISYETSVESTEIEVLPKIEKIPRKQSFHKEKTLPEPPDISEKQIIPESDIIPEPKPTRKNAYGVVIGIGKYNDPGIPPLKYAADDAIEIYNILTDPNFGNFPIENVKLLLDEQATLTGIKSAMGTFLARNAGKDDMVCIYFAGHGSPEIDPTGKADDRLDKFIVPYDAKKDDLFSYGLSMDEIRNIYERIQSNRIVFFIDSCYSGEAGGRTFSRPDVAARNITISEKFLEELSGEGRIIITASKPDELSLETSEFKHGIFTYYLSEGLKGKADMNKDGIVTIDELYSYVYDQVTKKARLLGANQHPLMKGTVIGEIPLTHYETQKMKKIKELLSDANQHIEHGKNENALRIYEDILIVDKENPDALGSINNLRKKIDEDTKKKNLKILSNFYYEGKFSATQYELTRRLIKSSPEDLSKDDKKVLKLLNDLLSDQISILTFKEEIECII